MSAKTNTVTVTVYRVTRRNNSVYGNPAYTFHTSNGQYLTSSNTSAAYRLTNEFTVDKSINNGDGVIVTFDTTRAGRVTDWKIVG